MAESPSVADEHKASVEKILTRVSNPIFTGTLNDEPDSQNVSEMLFLPQFRKEECANLITGSGLPVLACDEIGLAILDPCKYGLPKAFRHASGFKGEN